MQRRTERRRRRRRKAGNPLSTSCYLPVEGDALGQLVHGHLAAEVALLVGGADLHHDGDGDHHGDEEEAHAVDDHLQVGVVGRRVVGDGWTGETQVSGDSQRPANHSRTAHGPITGLKARTFSRWEEPRDRISRRLGTRLVHVGRRTGTCGGPGPGPPGLKDLTFTPTQHPEVAPARQKHQCLSGLSGSRCHGDGAGALSSAWDDFNHPV